MGGFLCDTLDNMDTLCTMLCSVGMSVYMARMGFEHILLYATRHTMLPETSPSTTALDSTRGVCTWHTWPATDGLGCFRGTRIAPASTYACSVEQAEIALLSLHNNTCI